MELQESDFQFLSAFFPKDIEFTAEEREKILSKIQIVTIERGQHFIQQGNRVTSLAVILKGIFRCVRVGRNGEESIISFPNEGMILTDYASWLTQQPATFFIEALEPARLAVLDYSDYLEFMKTIPGWQGLVLRHLGIALVTLSQREHSLLSKDAQQRYDDFLSQNQHLLNRIKRKDLASYLGITPVFLSRLSARKMSQNDKS